MYRKILHGNDASDTAFKALTQAIDLAKIYGSELHSIYVEEVTHYAGTVGEFIEEKEIQNGFIADAIKKASSLAEQNGIILHSHIVVGHEVKSIVEFIKINNFDLLIIGFMGRSAIYERVMGSTCQSLVRLAPCSVLVVK